MGYVQRKSLPDVLRNLHIAGLLTSWNIEEIGNMLDTAGDGYLFVSYLCDYLRSFSVYQELRAVSLSTDWFLQEAKKRVKKAIRAKNLQVMRLTQTLQRAEEDILLNDFYDLLLQVGMPEISFFEVFLLSNLIKRESVPKRASEQYVLCVADINAWFVALSEQVSDQQQFAEGEEEEAVD